MIKKQNIKITKHRLTICFNFDFVLKQLRVGVRCGAIIKASHCIRQRCDNKHQLFAVECLSVNDWLRSRSLSINKEESISQILIFSKYLCYKEIVSWFNRT